MLDIEVIEDPAVAACLLDPIRAEVLATLDEPGSATSVAKAIGQPRQKVNYHLRRLEGHGLVQLVEERARRGLTERMMVASARTYVVSPVALGRNAGDPAHIDRLSARYLIAIGARIIREVAEMVRGAERTGKPLATLTIDTDICFASAGDRAAFTDALGNHVAALAAQYHNETATDGRWHRLLVAAHPRPNSQPLPTETARHDR